ncbi:GNAT family acetyltransferase [Bifidobacterium sp. DSM 109960]|uniref:GNAT family acetyltransferase n=1 Tax=Bifidobacterium erythrocebi TaxID=2675325 RepID=A0A7Y0ETY9_9BIFI|nr:GNAT family N-acetyltransferase [Bifidobacterium sp. DSM 109960]NMM95321.1 GNAT family acetyltransferase [Bifidobacterium sp. DSM 109960]
MSQTMHVCTESDLDALRDLSIATYRQTFAAVNTEENMNAYLEDAFAADKLLRELRDESSEFVLAENDGRPAGYLKINEAPSQTEFNDTASLEIQRIYIDGRAQGKGLGTRLMQYAIDTAKERGKQYVWLGVWEHNDKAIRFYARNGFYRIGEHAFIMGDDKQTDHLMRKDLR